MGKKTWPLGQYDFRPEARVQVSWYRASLEGQPDHLGSHSASPSATPPGCTSWRCWDTEAGEGRQGSSSSLRNTSPVGLNGGYGGAAFTSAGPPSPCSKEGCNGGCTFRLQMDNDLGQGGTWGKDQGLCYLLAHQGSMFSEKLRSPESISGSAAEDPGPWLTLLPPQGCTQALGSAGSDLSLPQALIALPNHREDPNTGIWKHLEVSWWSQ